MVKRFVGFRPASGELQHASDVGQLLGAGSGKKAVCPILGRRMLGVSAAGVQCSLTGS